jgi:hypothetical protein
LKAECPQDIVEHFQKIVAKDIAMGTCERINNEYIFKTQDGLLIRRYSKDYNTDWNSTVSRINYIFEEEDWNFTALKLRSKTFETRVEDFQKRKNMYLSNGLPIFIWPIKNDGYCEIVEEKFENELIYPIEEHKHFADVVYTCDGCSKWTAKIGNREITDKDGNNWWYTKHEAEIAARWFCNHLEYRIRNGYED